MKRYNLVVALLLTVGLIGVSSCGDKVDSDGVLDVNFVLKYNGEPLVMLQDYKYPDGKTLMFNRFSFYFSNLRLVGNDGEARDNKTHMVNFTNTNSTIQGAKDGKTIRIEGLNSGKYKIMEICIGVSPNLNAKSPADFGNDDDLSATAEYWAGWKSYIFSRAEGFIDLDGDGTKEQGFALHTGSDQAYNCLNGLSELDISSKAQTLNIGVDLAKLFGPPPYYDIKANPQIHSLDQKAFVLTLAGNLAQGFEIIK